MLPKRKQHRSPMRVFRAGPFCPRTRERGTRPRTYESARGCTHNPQAAVLGLAQTLCAVGFFCQLNGSKPNETNPTHWQPVLPRRALQRHLESDALAVCVDGKLCPAGPGTVTFFSFLEHPAKPGSNQGRHLKTHCPTPTTQRQPHLQLLPKAARGWSEPFHSGRSLHLR